MERKKLIPIPSRGLMTERDIGKPPILDIHSLGIDFGGLHAVEDFTLVMGRTEITGLIGPNGAGKTTVFNLITNVYQPTRGVILLAAKKHGVDIYEYTPLQIKQSVVGYGRAEKKQIIYMTQLLLRLPEPAKPDDTADALAVAICHGNSMRGI